MKSYPLIKSFNGHKFAMRYGINSLRGDFWADENNLYLRDGLLLLDDPPIFEVDGLPPISIKDRLDAVTTLPQLITLLKEKLV